MFSTDCSTFQHWQSYLLFYTALRARQPGRVVRIASGCTDEEGEEARRWHDEHVSAAMSARFKLHLTPRFSGVMNDEGETVGDYKFFNKPFGLKHWLEHGDSMGTDPDTGKMTDEDAVVVLIDPDMVLLRPITSDFGPDWDTDPKRVAVGVEGLEKQRVDHGSPFGQTYGLGTGWMKFDLDAITGVTDSPAKSVTKDEGQYHYPVGPPYLGTARDMLSIATKWSEFAPKVHKQYPNLLAEMYAYCIAAAHLQLPHQRISSLMISQPKQRGEGWPLLEDMPPADTCSFARTLPSSSDNASLYPVPSVLHLCQRYIVGPWFWGKRRMPHNFFACDQPLLQDPPDDLASGYDYLIKPSEGVRADLSKEMARDTAFFVCSAVHFLNEAGTYYKSRHCNEWGEANLERTLNLADLWKVERDEKEEKKKKRRLGGKKN